MSKLYKIASKLGEKYSILRVSSVDPNTIKEFIRNKIQQDIINASTRNVGIMNFVPMLQADNADAMFMITASNGFWGMNITVTNPHFTGEKPELHQKYGVLMGQIQKYLNANKELFPQKYNDEKVDYSKPVAFFVYFK